MMHNWGMDSRSGSAGWNEQDWWDEQHGVPDSRPINPTGIYMGETGGALPCEWCKEPTAAVHEEDCFVDTDTEDDDRAADPEYDKLLSAANTSEAEYNRVAGYIREAYVVQKQCWRRIAGRYPRRTRFARRKGKGKGKRTF